MKRVQGLNPLVLALFSWAVTTGDVCLGQLLLTVFGWQTWAAVAIGILIVATNLCPIISIVFIAGHYKPSAASISKIVTLYVALVLVCANINFNLVLHFSQDVPFKGVDSAFWQASAPGEMAVMHWATFARAAASCIHFSLQSLSTFNDGEIVPVTWYAKVAVDIQVMMGLGITVLTVGRHFSQRSALQHVGSSLCADDTQSFHASAAPEVFASRLAKSVDRLVA